MAVNGVTDASSVSTYYNQTSPAKTAERAASTGASAEQDTAGTAAATYEKSDEATATAAVTSNPVRGAKNQALVDQMKADLQARQDQLTGIVQKMMEGQGLTIAKADDVWSFLAKGKFGTVSEAAKAQAQQDISEDGYWGVKQTSDRILDFAQALVGDDPDQLEKMRDAFKKGFQQATKSWGQDLPDISNQTYDAVMKGFDKLTQKNQEDAAAKTAQDNAVTVQQNSGNVQA